MKHVLLFLALLAVPVAASAQSAGSFARMGFGARGIAMGGALVADAFGDASPYYNPALTPFTSRQHLEASAALLSLDRELQFLQFAAPLRPRAGIAVGLIHAAVTGIDGRNGSGYHTQEYRTDEFAGFLTFGTKLGNRVSAGLGFQLFRSDLLEGLKAETSIGLDLGLTARVTEALWLGLTVEDVLARYSWDTSGLYGDAGKTTTDRFPVRLRVGAAYQVPGLDARVTAEYESQVRPAEWRQRSFELVGDAPSETTTVETLQMQAHQFRLGGEYRLAEPFTVRAGLDRLGTDGLGGTRPSFGFMVEQPVGSLTFRGEYAFLAERYDAGTTHVITMRVYL